VAVPPLQSIAVVTAAWLILVAELHQHLSYWSTRFCIGDAINCAVPADTPAKTPSLLVFSVKGMAV
jgi:hypothetical protein